MARCCFNIGELVEIEPGYESGIWVRSNRVFANNRDVKKLLSGRLAIVLEVVGTDVKIIGGDGVVGWTWENRLRKLI